MNRKRTYKQAAENFDLWGEYVDPDATWTKEDFDAATTEEKIEIQVECFGPEESEDE